MQVSLSQQFHHLALTTRLSSQSLSNILLNLGKMQYYYNDYSDNMKTSLEINLRKILNKKLYKSEYDFLQIIYSMVVIQIKWSYLTNNTKMAISNTVFSRSKEWVKKGQSCLIEYSILLTYLYQLDMSWSDTLPTMRSGILLGQ